MAYLATKLSAVRLPFTTINTTDLNRALTLCEDIVDLPRTKTADAFVQLDAPVGAARS